MDGGRLARIFAVVLGLVPAALVLYTLAALAALPLAPRVPLPERGIPIYACDRGVHTDLVLPVAAAGVDWRASFPADAFAGAVDAYDHIAVGWGSRDFYLNARSWRDVDFTTAIRSVLWDETLLHVEYQPAPGPDEPCGRWLADDAAYQRIAGFVLDSARASGSRAVAVAPGYGTRDAFFAAEGRYTILETCNQWTGRALRLAPAPVAPWTPYSFLVVWHLPAASG